jgi:hypothetical protein
MHWDDKGNWINDAFSHSRILKGIFIQVPLERHKRRGSYMQENICFEFHRLIPLIKIFSTAKSCPPLTPQLQA